MADAGVMQEILTVPIAKSVGYVQESACCGRLMQRSAWMCNLPRKS